ncbi:zinc knuckle CX2CX4HX4C containing protein [Tanacetum coccineum]
MEKGLTNGTKNPQLDERVKLFPFFGTLVRTRGRAVDEVKDTKTLTVKGEDVVANHEIRLGREAWVVRWKGAYERRDFRERFWKGAYDWREFREFVMVIRIEALCLGFDGVALIEATQGGRQGEGANVSIPRKIVETAFTEDGLSIIASKLGKPIMLDSYTSSICIESWGRSSFARCLIEINAEDVLQDSLTIGIPCEDDGFSIETVSIEYELKPPHCDLCNIFGHSHDCCPKKVLIPNAETSNVITPNVVNTSTVPTPLVQKTNDGFQTVGKKKKKKGKSKSNVVGPSIKQNVRYEPKASTSAPKKTTTNVGNVSNSSSLLKNMVNSPNQDNITSSNSFAALNKDIEDEEEVENVFDETANLFNSKTGGRSSFTAVG